MKFASLCIALIGWSGCESSDSKPGEAVSPASDTSEGSSDESHGNTDPDTGSDTGRLSDTGAATDTGNTDVEPEPFVPDWPEGTDPFADAVSAFEPGPDSGFGSEEFPDIVLGPPEGAGMSGSVDVLSLGELGTITVEMTDLEVYDGPGPDLIVFENAFTGWIETGVVEVSVDGAEWVGWTCEAENSDEGFPGCAGVNHVYATSAFEVDPTDPLVAGGDAFDLADLGLESARFIRITDSGFNAIGYGTETGGFDLDAVGAANWRIISEPDAPSEGS